MDRVFWKGRDNQNYLIINVFPNAAQLQAVTPVERNTLLINTALVEGALQFERPEHRALTTLNLLLVSMRDMSEYGGTSGNWTQVGTGLLVKGDGKVELRDVKLEGALPAPMPTVAFPYNELSTTATASAIRFRMPEKIYLVAGEPQHFFYENLVVAKDIEEYVYSPAGNAVGFAEFGRRGLIFKPQDSHVGEHDLAIKVADWDGKVVAEGATKVVVTPAAMSWQPAANEPVRILVIGHSLPAMYWPAFLADFLAGPGNPKVTFVGGIKYWYGKHPDFKNNPPLEEMHHQASPGYSVKTMLQLYTEEPPAHPNMPAKSPFIFKNADGKPTFDIKRYFAETLNSKSPHFVLLNIGDNDTFALDPNLKDSPVEKEFVADMNIFLDELREIAPDAVFGAVMPNTYNYSDRSFLFNYGKAYPRWQSMQNRQRYIELMIGIAASRGDLSIIPSNFGVDSVDGMPHNSGTHFNNIGARQFASSIYAWLKAQFALKGGQAQRSEGAVAAATPAAAAPLPESSGWFTRQYIRIMSVLSFN